MAIDALTELLPPSSTTEYERHLTGMMHELKQLQSTMSGGPVIIMSCTKDAHSNDNKAVDAEKLQADLSAHKIDAVSVDISSKDGKAALGSKLTTCLAIVVVISEQFCSNKSCADVFSYVRRNVQRPLICVVISSTDEWRQTTTGGVVATEMYVNMADVEQYTLKLDELMRRIQSKAALGGQRTKAVDFAVFISYCWANSKDAVAKGTRKVAGALGEVDPRGLEEFLREKGVSTWLDIKCVREGALFEEIAEALRRATLVVVCVSDEYIKSTNCMMEFRFAAGILKLPLLLCPVGTGRKWQTSEVAMLALSAQRIDMQIKVDQNFDALLTVVNEKIQEVKAEKRSAKRKAVSSVVKKKTRKTKEKQKNDKDSEEGSSSNSTTSSAARRRRSERSRSVKKPAPAPPPPPPASSSTNTVPEANGGVPSTNIKESNAVQSVNTENYSAYEEMCELAQRKFLQQCMQVSQEIASQPTFEWFTAHPNLIFLDKVIDDTDDRTIRPPTALKSNKNRNEGANQSDDGVTIVSLWELIGLSTNNVCLRFLCENDGVSSQLLFRFQIIEIVFY